MFTPKIIEVRGFKWPYRPTSVAQVYLLGEDAYGRWLGIAKGTSWRNHELAPLLNYKGGKHG